MSKRLFGTDGIRGVANEKLTPELAFSMGQAAGRLLAEEGAPLRVAIGRDTRRSGPMLGAALASGFCSVGVDVATLGVVPTPVLSFATRAAGYSLGVVISASHNPAPDNGIKFFGSDGRKLSDAREQRLEALMAEPVSSRPTGGGVGYLQPDEAVAAGYLGFLQTLVPEGLSGLNVVMDAAHGAAYELGPEVFRALGANVTVIGARPDGMNINEDGGATKPETVQRATESGDFDLGIAFDGDADRAVFSDRKGRLINGDRAMGIWALEEKRQGRLTPPVLVGTVMSNGGFEAYLVAQGLRLQRAPVGDKYVAQEIAATGARIGGEQSGHIIFPEIGPTGDGIATALLAARAILTSGRTSDAFFDDYTPWPQLLINVAVGTREGWENAPNLSIVRQHAEERLEGRGRVNIRPSGTQPMIRIMVEADNEALRDEVAANLVEAMIADLGGKIYSKVDLTYALGD